MSFFDVKYQKIVEEKPSLAKYIVLIQNEMSLERVNLVILCNLLD